MHAQTIIHNSTLLKENQKTKQNNHSSVQFPTVFFHYSLPAPARLPRSAAGLVCGQCRLRTFIIQKRIKNHLQIFFLFRSNFNFDCFMNFCSFFPFFFFQFCVVIVSSRFSNISLFNCSQIGGNRSLPGPLKKYIKKTIIQKHKSFPNSNRSIPNHA
jgi:hypothetical protein